MDVVTDVVLAIAVIAAAAGAIAEIKVGVGSVCPAANGTFVQEGFLGGGVSCLDGGRGGELDHSCFPGSGSLSNTFADLEPQGEGDDVGRRFSC